MFQLILNADDFGLTQGVNDAVFELARLGALSSTTVMVNMPYAEPARDLLKINYFGVGLHFNLTEGRPVSKASSVTTLIDEDGRFHDFKGLIDRLRSGRVKEAQIDMELQAQWARLSEILGQSAGHVDSHQNIHKQPAVCRVLAHFGRTHADSPRSRVDLTGEAINTAAEQGGKANPATTLRPRLGVRNPHRFVCETDRPHARPVASWRHSLRQGKLKRMLTDLYLWRTGRVLQRGFRVPDGELHAANSQKLELLQAIRSGDFPFASGDGLFEVACHPAVSTEGLGKDKLQDKRVQEYQCLRDPQFTENLSEARSSWDAVVGGRWLGG
ncbi:MAG: ChbG/HpnK family deacetylase [Verrucomicrobia bacterium]|nr:ChbG/HpnK family deacetylase [Verrucomicrobiota bacterium]